MTDRKIDKWKKKQVHCSTCCIQKGGEIYEKEEGGQLSVSGLAPGIGVLPSSSEQLKSYIASYI